VHLRRDRVVAAFASAEPALAFARTLAAADPAARVALGVDDLPCDRDGRLAPRRANVEPPWLPHAWTGTIGTAAIARLLDREAPGDLVDLGAGAPPRDAHPLVGRDRELARATAWRQSTSTGAARVLVVTGPSGSGRSRLARALAAPSLPLSARDPAATIAGVGTEATIVVDDAGEASDALVQALERAAGPIALVGGADVRGRFARLLDATTVEVVELGPLDGDASARLLEAALGVERIAGAVVHRLVELGEGSPRRLLAIAEHLRASGAIRAHAGSQRRYLAAEAVSLPDGGAEAWLADAALAALAPELRAVAAACACLAPGFELAEVEAALAHVAGAADAEVALVALATRGLAARTGDGWRLSSEPFARAAAAHAPRDVIAQAALVHADAAWDRAELDGRRRRALAHYAAAAGALDRAWRHYLELADDNRCAHRDTEAEADYTRALSFLPGDRRRAAALAHLGRGTVRYRADRASEAVADLAEAARLARELGDPALEARAHLEAATALDWLGDYEASARASVEAAARAPANEARLACGLAMARGRTAVREGRYREARAALEEALEVEGGDADERFVAKVLLGPALVQLEELDAAERIYASALADAEAQGDALGRSVAHGNRVLLWAARGDHARALADLAAARDLARSVGHAVPERTTTYNLAEYLYWHGDLAEAARLADASRALQHGLVGEALEDDVLIARIAAARGDEPTARAALARASAARRACPTAIATLRDAALAYLDRDLPRLDALAAAARASLVGEELTEVLAWRASARGETLPDAGLQTWRFV
ncbi:MAG: hypothetical protein KF773_43010, partial [Deltaproteobacteria bacterium]|nr:hypothetical protein [Deltaproteobacteria bacterium]